MTSHLLWPLGRYIGCAYPSYYPEGAFNDVVGSYDTLELAMEDLTHFNYEIRYVIDSQTGEVTNFQANPLRAIVSVGTCERHWDNMERLRKQVARDNVCIFYDKLPPESPTHEDQPYGFKVAAIRQAAKHGAKSILWCDSSIVALKPLEPLWDLIDKQGYWFSKNYDYNQGQFCNDEALAIMGVTREQAFEIPQVVGGCFGLRVDHPVAREFFYRWARLLEEGAFRGDRGDLSGSGDMTKFVGHRNDQACASDVCHKLGMKLTEPPAWFAEQGYPTTEETILTVER